MKNTIFYTIAFTAIIASTAPAIAMQGNNKPQGNAAFQAIKMFFTKSTPTNFDNGSQAAINDVIKRIHELNKSTPHFKAFGIYGSLNKDTHLTRKHTNKRTKMQPQDFIWIFRNFSHEQLNQKERDLGLTEIGLTYKLLQTTQNQANQNNQQQ